MEEYNKKYDEIITLYTLENELVDYFVEGPNDKLVFENYAESRSINASFIEIDIVDFEGITSLIEDLDLKSNKDKLICLSRGLIRENIKSKVHCVVDKDFDGILKKAEENKYLIRTDYSCLESFFFNAIFLSKIFKGAITKFPFEADFVISQLSRILKDLFLMRLIRFRFGINEKLPRLDNAVKIQKKTGIIEFNFNTYLNNFINRNKISGIKNDIYNFIDEISDNLQGDNRCFMNGHDFVELLFLYINKIKNTQNFRLENFERLLFCSIQPDFFDDYELFIFFRNN